MFAIDMYRAVLGSVHGIFKMIYSNKCFVFSVLGLVKCCFLAFSVMRRKPTYEISSVKDKPRHSKILRIYLSKNRFELGSTKSKVGKSRGGAGVGQVKLL